MSRSDGVGYHTGCIPVEPLATLVEDYLKTQEKEGAEGSDTAGPRGMLCIRAKVNPKRLSQLMGRKTKWIDFGNADKLLCAINKTDYLLFHPELSKQYFQVSLSCKSKASDWFAEIDDSVCKECGKTFQFYSNFTGKRDRLFCSQTCGNRNASNKRWIEAA